MLDVLTILAHDVAASKRYLERTCEERDRAVVDAWALGRKTVEEIAQLAELQVPEVTLIIRRSGVYAARQPTVLGGE
jgi:hypothetical protein